MLELIQIEMLQTIKKYLQTQFVVILVLTTVVDNCFGQRVFSSSRSNRLVQYNPRYNDRQRATQLRRAQFGNYNNQISDTNVVLRDNHNNVNTNRDGTRYRNSRVNTRNRQGSNTRRHEYSSPSQQNSLSNVRTHQNRPSDFNVQRNTRKRQRPVRQYRTRAAPRTQIHRYQEHNDRQNNNANQRARNRMHSSHITHQQTQRQSNNRLASSGGDQRLVANSGVRSYRKQGARNNNDVVASQRSRFGSRRNELRNRPTHTRTTQDNIVRGAFKRIDSPGSSHDSLSVPIDSYMSTFRSLYENRYGTDFDSTYQIPEAKVLPRGLEFVGQSYEARRKSSSGRRSGRQRNQRNQSFQDITAKDFGSVLGISEEQISAIVRAPSMQLTRGSHYPLEDTGNVANNPSVRVVTRNGLTESKAGLLANIDNTIDQLVSQDKINMFNDFNTDIGDSNSKAHNNMPDSVKMIIISDANTFSKLEADASATGSILSDLPRSAVNINTYRSEKNERSAPTVVVKRPSHRGYSKGYRETDSIINQRTVGQSVNDNKVTVVVRDIAKPRRTMSTSSRSSDRRRNTRVMTRNNWDDMGYYNDIYSNFIDDRRW